jgi:hypothetical protein
LTFLHTTSFTTWGKALRTRLSRAAVRQRWLKDRKGRLLGFVDMTHCANVVAALTHTWHLMAQADALVSGKLWPLNPSVAK